MTAQRLRWRAGRARGPSRGTSSRTTAGALVSGLAIQALLTATGPLLARMLLPEGRGVMAALLLWPVVLAYLGSLGLPSAVTYELARRTVDARKLLRDVLPLALSQLVVLTALHAVLLFLVLPDYARTWAGVVTLTGVPSALVLQYALAILQGEQRFGLFNACRVLVIALYAGAVSALFLVGSESLLLAVAAWLGAQAAVALLASLLALRSLPASTEAGESAALRELLSFGVKGIFVSLSPVRSFRIDQLVLALFLPPAALGFYVVGLAFTNIPHFIGESMGGIAFPRIAATADRDAAHRRLWAFFGAGFVLSAITVFPLFALADVIVPLFFGSAFADSIEIVRVLLPGAVFFGARRVLAEGLRGRGRPILGTAAEIGALVSLAAALPPALAAWGVVGVAVALSASNAAGLVMLIALAALTGELRLTPSRHPAASARSSSRG